MAKGKHVIKLGLVEGRHEMPVSSYVFNEISADITDIATLNNLAYDNIMNIGGWDANDTELWIGSTFAAEGYAPHECILHLYVFELTYVVIAVLNACRALWLDVILYHYDRDTDSYYPQQVL